MWGTLQGRTSYLYCDYYRHYPSICAVRTVYSPAPILDIEPVRPSEWITLYLFLLTEPKVYRTFHAVIRRYHPEQHLSHTYRYAPAFACPRPSSSSLGGAVDAGGRAGSSEDSQKKRARAGIRRDFPGLGRRAKLIVVPPWDSPASLGGVSNSIMSSSSSRSSKDRSGVITSLILG